MLPKFVKVHDRVKFVIYTTIHPCVIRVMILIIKLTITVVVVIHQAKASPQIHIAVPSNRTTAHRNQ